MQEIRRNIIDGIDRKYKTIKMDSMIAVNEEFETQCVEKYLSLNNSKKELVVQI